MPVACARATGATPATAATTSNATSRPMACLREIESVRQGTQAAPHRSATPNATARPRAGEPCDRRQDLEPNAARKNESLPAAEFSASLCEWDQVRALHSERGAAEHVQSCLRVGGADGRRPDGRRGAEVGDVQSTTRVGPQGGPGRDTEAIRDVAVDLPVLHAIPWKEIVERHDAVERRPGQQGPQWEHTSPTDSEVGVIAPIELQPERRAVRRPGR